MQYTIYRKATLAAGDHTAPPIRHPRPSGHDTTVRCRLPRLDVRRISGHAELPGGITQSAAARCRSPGRFER